MCVCMCGCKACIGSWVQTCLNSPWGAYKGLHWVGTRVRRCTYTTLPDVSGRSICSWDECCGRFWAVWCLNKSPGLSGCEATRLIDGNPSYTCCWSHPPAIAHLSVPVLFVLSLCSLPLSATRRIAPLTLFSCLLRCLGTLSSPVTMVLWPSRLLTPAEFRSRCPSRAA